MIGYHTTTHGNYKCDFCDRRAFKSASGIDNHLENNHKVELLEARLKAKDDTIDSKNRRIRELEQKPAVKEEPKKEFYDARVFCTTCKFVFDTGIPRGQTIEGTPHSDCGTKGLLPVFKTAIRW